MKLIDGKKQANDIKEELKDKSIEVKENISLENNENNEFHA